MRDLFKVFSILIVAALFSIPTCEELYPPYSQLDLVVVIDTTGSMAFLLRTLMPGFSAIVESLGTWGIDAKYGLVTFGDGFNFPIGDTLISDGSAFYEKLFYTNCMGGADVPEEALDALMAAADSLSWRDTSLKVILLFTDSDFCFRMSTCFSCSSMWMPNEVVDSLVARRIIVFSIIKIPLWHHACAAMSDSDEMAWYNRLAWRTGGKKLNLQSIVLFDSLIASLKNLILLNVEENNEGNANILISPNPFNENCRILFSIPHDYGEIAIYSPDGKMILRKSFNSGQHEVEFDAENLPSGVYIAVLRAGKFTVKKSLIMIK